MSDEKKTRTGKIASLPARIREQVNIRLHDGQKSPKIIAWLHEIPEVLTILDDEWGEEPISAQNISEWRRGGYQDWLARRERVENIKVLSDYSFQLAKNAGTAISDAAAAVAGGQILEALEKINASEGAEEKIIGLSLAIAKLRDGDSKIVRARVSERNADQKDRQLDFDETKFQYGTAEKFLDWARTKAAQAILDSGEPRAVQLPKMVQLMFGPRPEGPIGAV